MSEPNPGQQMPSQTEELFFPFLDAPKFGELVEVSPGILWARMPLPFKLDHVNVYLVKDDAGWIIFDTGINDEKTRQIWEQLFGGPLKGQRITGVMVSHHDPDHIGLAGWLCERLGVRLQTSLGSYLSCSNISLNPWTLQTEFYRKFYRAHGMDEEAAGVVGDMGREYLSMVSALPQTFKRIVGGDVIKIGNRKFLAFSGNGHAPEQIMLYCETAKILLVADQVLAKITPNVSVWAEQPDDDPLDLYLRTLRMLQLNLPADVLVLPGHRLPFKGLHLRCDQIMVHHAERCDLIYQSCRKSSQSIAELTPILFRSDLDPHQKSFAFGEALAHVNFMIAEGRLSRVIDDDGCYKFSAI
jgi:glyoxylase-like metal-dependent hydrolase (beta-lactamase superfamily II)